jgi:hypothetical protein
LEPSAEAATGREDAPVEQWTYIPEILAHETWCVACKKKYVVGYGYDRRSKTKRHIETQRHRNNVAQMARSAPAKQGPTSHPLPPNLETP